MENYNSTLVENKWQDFFEKKKKPSEQKTIIIKNFIA
jgi:hypothetical protein